MNFKVSYNYLPEQFSNFETFFELWKPVLKSGEFTLGPFVEEFENKFAKFVNAKFCIATNNGTDALILGLKALGISNGDEVITPANSFYATTGAIVATGATPVFCDVDDRYQSDLSDMEKMITKKTKALLPVHWAGASPSMSKIKDLANTYSLKVVEDACMAIGGKIEGIHPGTIGDLGAFSMHPLKSLNVAGDGGMVVTDNPDLYTWMKKYRNHGMKNRDEIDFWGVNMRIQPLQAVIANYFLDQVDDLVKKRNENALYLDSLLNKLSPNVIVPYRINSNLETFSLYMVLVKNRDLLLKFLISKGIEAKIHYPIPLHKQNASRNFNARSLPKVESQADSLITIPVHQYLNTNHMDFVFEAMHEFYDGQG